MEDAAAVMHGWYFLPNSSSRKCSRLAGKLRSHENTIKSEPVVSSILFQDEKGSNKKKQLAALGSAPAFIWKSTGFRMHAITQKPGAVDISVQSL